MAAATENLNSATENLKNKASDVATNVADKAKHAASAAGQKAEDATHAVGGGMRSLADTMRQKGPQEGVLGAATSSVAKGLDAGGQYLEQEGIKGMATDLTNLIRNNPIPVMLAAVGLGFFLARATSRR